MGAAPPLPPTAPPPVKAIPAPAAGFGLRFAGEASEGGRAYCGIATVALLAVVGTFVPVVGADADAAPSCSPADSFPFPSPPLVVAAAVGSAVTLPVVATPTGPEAGPKPDATAPLPLLPSAGCATSRLRGRDGMPDADDRVAFRPLPPAVVVVAPPPGPTTPLDVMLPPALPDPLVAVRPSSPAARPASPTAAAGAARTLLAAGVAILDLGAGRALADPDAPIVVVA